MIFCLFYAHFNMLKSAARTAQDIQDDMFRRMSAGKKVKLTWDFSLHLMKLNRGCRNHVFCCRSDDMSRKAGRIILANQNKKVKNGIQRTGRPNRKNFVRS